MDLVDLESVKRQIYAAVINRRSYFLSTPNLNFLLQSQEDPEFREALLASDLCPADGMPIVWLARLMGVSHMRRVAGADIFDALKKQSTQPLRVFLFGGADGVANVVAGRINQHPGMRCVGSIFPGFGTIEQMSSHDIIDKINASCADFVAVFLNAKKGQQWLMRNGSQLTVPLRAQLGATINFQAGTLRRAPPWLRAVGLEWLWRVMYEPFLWRRYLVDGFGLLRLLTTSVAPLMAYRLLERSRSGSALDVALVEQGKVLRVCLRGSATNAAIETLRMRLATTAGRANTVIDMTAVTHIDTGFLGLLLALRKVLIERGMTLSIVGTSPGVSRLFRLHRFGYLLR